MSLKSACVKLLYSCLETLPTSLANKLKMMGNIAVHDWQMESFCMFDIREAMEEEQAKALFSPNDEMTQHIVHQQYVLGNLYIPPEVKNCFFFHHRKELHFPFEGDIRQIKRSEDAFKAQYGLTDVGPEVTYYHNGLFFLNEHERALISGKCIIDAGAYQGESVIALLEANPLRVIAFELSPKNYCKMEANLRRNHIPKERYELVSCGLGAVEEDICINDTGEAITSRQNEGDLSCHITTIDKYTQLHPVQIGMIKADVEGDGLELIKGALATIRRDRPILSIAVYHSADEFLGIPKLLINNNLGYRFILRSLSPFTTLGEIVLLGLPE